MRANTLLKKCSKTFQTDKLYTFKKVQQNNFAPLFLKVDKVDKIETNYIKDNRNLKLY